MYIYNFIYSAQKTEGIVIQTYTDYRLHVTRYKRDIKPSSSFVISQHLCLCLLDKA